MPFLKVILPISPIMVIVNSIKIAPLLANSFFEEFASLGDVFLPMRQNLFYL